VLWYGGEALVEDVLETPVVGADRERATPQVWPPVSDGLHQADELALIRRQLGVLWRHHSTEERQRAVALVQHRTKSRPGRVAVDGEALGEVGQLE